MIIKREDIYKILRAQLKGDYSIGLHGITSLGPRWNDGVQTTDEEIAIAADEIMQNGLRVYNDRTINGTVAFFGRIDDADNTDRLVNEGLLSYNYGRRAIILLAIPTTMKSEDGRSMYLGDSKIHGEYDRYIDTQGYQTSTLRDEALSTTVISNRYILGEYKLLPDGKVDFKINHEHMSFKGDVIPDRDFDKIESKVNRYITGNLIWPLNRMMDTKNIPKYETIGDSERIEMYETIRNLLLDGKVPFGSQEGVAAYLETLKQYINEPQMRKLENQEDIDVDELLVELHEKVDEYEVNPEYVFNENDDVYETLEKLDKLNISNSENGYPLCGIDGGVNYLNDVCGSTTFLRKALSTLQDVDLSNFLNFYFTYVTPDVASEVLTEDLWSKIVSDCPTIIGFEPISSIVDEQIIRDVVSKGGVKPIIIHYLPDELLSDYDFMISLIQNAPERGFDFYFEDLDEEASNLLYYKEISKEILVKPEFWLELNKKYRSFKKDENSYMPQFNIPKELAIYREELADERAEQSELAIREARLVSLEEIEKGLNAELFELEELNQNPDLGE